MHLKYELSVVGVSVCIQGCPGKEQKMKRINQREDCKRAKLFLTLDALKYMKCGSVMKAKILFEDACYWRYFLKVVLTLYIETGIFDSVYSLQVHYSEDFLINVKRSDESIYE